MVGKLRFDGVNDLVTFISACSVNWGTAAYFIEIGMVARRFPASGNDYFTGNSGATPTGVCLRAASGDGALAIVAGGTFRYASSPGLVILDEYHVYRLEHDASASGGQWRWYRDGVLFGSTGNFTANAAAAFNVFGRGSTTNPFVPFDLGYMEISGFTNSQKWSAELSAGTGNILPTVSGSNIGELVNFPTNDDQWVDFGGGGTAQPVTSVNAQQLTEAVTALISSRQVAASIPAEQVTQAVTASVAVRQSVVSIPAQQLTESNLVTIAVTMGITSVDAEQQTQSVLAAVSVRQVVTAGIAEQITEAVTVNIGQGAGSQVVTSINAQQLTEAVTASASVKQVVTVPAVEQLTEAVAAAVRMSQVVTSIPAEQITQCVVVEISQPGDSGTSQPVTAIQCEQITQAVIAYISNHQVVTALPAEQLTEAVTTPVSMSQKIQVIVAEQLTEAVTAGEPLPPTFVAFNIKVTALPSPFTIKDVTPIYKAYQ